ncbi:hypothetical protein [Cupriavidus oxalaticus]|jgi:hypothetical protein|uniref:hypothetical protein n=1 Tax=Cupriavidus oxalaticus TaxID=96344 RepID=UPI00403432C2
MSEQRVRLEREGDVGVIVIDNLPINAVSMDVRSGLLQAMHEMQADTSLRRADRRGKNHAEQNDSARFVPLGELFSDTTLRRGELAADGLEPDRAPSCSTAVTETGGTGRGM